MLGSIIGDIVGSIYEFDNIKTKDFPFFSKKAEYTDDSILTLATAKWILEGASLNESGRYYYRYAFNHPYPMGAYGTSFVQWVRRAENGDFSPYNSCGNGSAMRVGPVGWAYNTKEDVLAAAKASAECTHNHPEGIKGAQAVALSIFMARNGASKEQIRFTIEKEFGYDLDFTCESIRDDYGWHSSFGNGGTCQGSVPQALVAFLDGEDFEDSIRNAISIGGDSDTIGCITGSIAEAYFGIPVDIYEEGLSYLTPHFKSLVTEFEEKYGKKLTNGHNEDSADMFLPIPYLDFSVSSLRKDLFNKKCLLYDNYNMAYTSMSNPVVITLDASALIAAGVEMKEIKNHIWEIDNLDEKYIKRECYLDKRYDEVRYIGNGIKIARSGACYSYLDKNNNVFVHGLCHAEPFVDGWARVRDVFTPDPDYYLIDKTGAGMLVNGKYLTWAESMYEGKAFVQVDEKDYYLVDKYAHVLSGPFKYFDRPWEDPSIVIVHTAENLMGIVNTHEGKNVVPCEYDIFNDAIEEISIKDGFVIMSKLHFYNEEAPDIDQSEKRYFFYTLVGSTIVDYFDEYESYRDAYLVRINDMWGCIKKNLEYLLIPTCESKEIAIKEVERLQA